MKRILLVLAIMMATVYNLDASPVSAAQARQVAGSFFSAREHRFTAPAAQSALRLAYTAEQGRFYVFDRSSRGGFVVVSGDDRLPQVIGYSDHATFSSGNIPPGMQDWMAEMNREIAYLQAHSGVPVHQPVKRATAIGPLMTTLWDQGWPYNNMCPTYISSKGEERAVTGCIATAMAQIMNYHQWPLRGTGSHTYQCNVNDTDPKTLSADFSQSVYAWDLMLDAYDGNSSEESCNAVAKLMSDAGISVDMGYGSSSGAQETSVVYALKRYFGYSDRHYLLQRDLYGASEWDQLLTDELAAGRPILYCGYTYSQGSLGGHAFVFDGVDQDGLFHVNWGWGGTGDGYFMVSLLAPGSGNNFKYGQDAIFGVVPAHDADQVAGVLYVRGLLTPDTYSLPRGEQVSLKFSDIYAEGNLMDSVGVDGMGHWQSVYDMIPMELRVLDQDGQELQSCQFTHKVYIDGWGPESPMIEFTPGASLADGVYTVKIAYSPLKDGHYDSWVKDEYGNDVYCKMRLSDGMVYMTDCFLSGTYQLEALNVGERIHVGDTLDIDVTLAYPRRWGGAPDLSPIGDIRLSLQQGGVEVAASEPLSVSVPYDSQASFSMQLTAPAQWGRYELMVVDDCGRLFQPASDWLGPEDDAGIMPIMIVPRGNELVEDFESMPVSTKTSDAGVQGRFTTWNFTKGGVRAPGEGRCNGTNSVMMKKGSSVYTAQPLAHGFFLAQATVFNQSTTAAKYTLEYSHDGTTWHKASTIEGLAAAEIPGQSQTLAFWMLNLNPSRPAYFRLAMTAGGSAATYLDDIVLYYRDAMGDVNVDGEVNLADVNMIIDAILTGATMPMADVNVDGEVNIADVNTLIDMIMVH